MTGRHRRPATSAINAARIAFAGVIIGGGGLALAGQTSAATGGGWDQLAHAALAPQTGTVHVPLAPAPDDPPLPPAPPPATPGPAPVAAGPPTVPPVPTDQQTSTGGQLDYLRQAWHEFHDHPDDVIAGLTPGDTDADAPPPAAAPIAPPPGVQPLPPGMQPLPPDQQPYPMHAAPQPAGPPGPPPP